MNTKMTLGAAVITVLFCAGWALAQADQSPRQELPAPVRAAIDKAYPGNVIVDVKRELRNGVEVYTIIFATQEGEKIKAVAGEDGTMLAEARRISPDAMPEAVKRCIQKEVPAGAVLDALKYRTTHEALNGRTVKLDAPRLQYEAMVQSDLGVTVLLIDADGTLIRKDGA
ncbi:MAG: hypothetical protein ABFD92_00435 [Planctomycetaceae bacterium]|nr:hypothetical protein [Planctomycetaceae bacterium]